MDLDLIEVGAQTAQALPRGDRFSAVDRHLGGEGLAKAVVIDPP